MFCPSITAATAVLFASTSVCAVASPTAHIAAQAGDSASSLTATNGAPDAKRIMNTEGSPLKGELWVYFGAESNREYLVRDGKICWTGEVFHRTGRTDETRLAGD